MTTEVGPDTPGARWDEASMQWTTEPVPTAYMTADDDGKGLTIHYPEDGWREAKAHLPEVGEAFPPLRMFIRGLRAGMKVSLSRPSRMGRSRVFAVGELTDEFDDDEGHAWNWRRLPDPVDLRRRNVAPRQ